MTTTKPLILAIDDVRSSMLPLGLLLQEEFEFQLVTSGKEGIKAAFEFLPMLILLDIIMPEMDGFETFQRLKADPKTARIPVIFVTGLHDIEAEASGLALGAADYLHKPINLNIAHQRIRNLMEREQLRLEVEAQRDRLDAEVKRQTMTLSIAKEAAETANRAKTRFLANMSHELRTPLNVIAGMTSVIMRRVDDPALKDKLGKITTASEHLLGLIINILDVSKMEADQLSLEPRQFRLGALVEQVVSQQESRATAKGLSWSLVSDPEVDALQLIGDDLRIGEVLLHITGNAIKFTRTGAVALRVMISAIADSLVTIRFEIHDSGIGISPELIKRLYSSFEQGDNSSTRAYGGAGLGLALSKRLIELMQGRFGVDSTPGEGSMFWIEMELALPDAAVSPAPTFD